MSETVLNIHLPQLRQFPVLTLAEVTELVERMRGDDPEDARQAFQWLVSCNLKLAVEFANRYYRRLPVVVRKSIDKADLIQAGYEGVMDAVPRFEPAKGFAFSTYAAWYVEKHIRDYLKYHAYTVRLPSDLAPMRQSTYEARDELMGEGITCPTDEQLAQRINERRARAGKKTRVTVNQVARLREWDQLGLCSLDAVEAPVVADRQSADPEQEAISAVMSERVRAEISRLDIQVAAALSAYFGINGNEPMLYHEIAPRLGVSPSRVGALVRQGLRELEQRLGGDYRRVRSRKSPAVTANAA